MTNMGYLILTFPHAQEEVPRWQGEVPHRRQTYHLHQVVDYIADFKDHGTLDHLLFYNKVRAFLNHPCNKR